MIDNDDTSDNDNTLRGTFDSLRSVSGTPITESTYSDSSHRTRKPKPPITKLKQGEIEMADVDTNLLASQHADIRREAAAYAADIRYGQASNTADIRREVAMAADEATDTTLEQAGNVRREVASGFNEAIKESIKGDWHVTDTVKDARYDVASRVEDSADRLSNQATQFYIAGQKNATDAATDLASLKVLTDANAGRISTELALGIEKAAAAAMLSAEKIGTAVALGQAALSKDVFMDGQKTRDLINDLKYHDLNRALIERNTELVEEREGRRHWKYYADQNQFQGQWASLQSQIQAFQSQLQETRQGMVNFGTMAGVGQTSTSNNVR